MRCKVELAGRVAKRYPPDVVYDTPKGQLTVNSVRSAAGQLIVDSYDYIVKRLSGLLARLDANTLAKWTGSWRRSHVHLPPKPPALRNRPGAAPRTKC